VLLNTNLSAIEIRFPSRSQRSVLIIEYQLANDRELKAVTL